MPWFAILKSFLLQHFKDTPFLSRNYTQTHIVPNAVYILCTD